MKCITVLQIDCDIRCDPKLISYITTPDEKTIPVIMAGTLIDQAECPTADCVRLVRSGLADPADDECREAAAMTPQQIAARQAAMRKLAMLPMDEDDEDDEEEEDE